MKDQDCDIHSEIDDFNCISSKAMHCIHCISSKKMICIVHHEDIQSLINSVPTGRSKLNYVSAFCNTMHSLMVHGRERTNVLQYFCRYGQQCKILIDKARDFLHHMQPRLHQSEIRSVAIKEVRAKAKINFQPLSARKPQSRVDLYSGGKFYFQHFVFQDLAFNSHGLKFPLWLTFHCSGVI